MDLIVIDGASSSGRTSLVRHLARRGDCRGYHVDEFAGNLPADVWSRCAGSDLGWAEIGERFNEFLHERSRIERPLVADVFYKLPRARDHLFGLFGRDRVFYVQLYCQLDELERRELLRGDRHVGLARSQFEPVYAFTGYDLRIDSTHRCVGECADVLRANLTLRP